jgi:thiamine phosphate synthase YjbQ (UPF0047 family)
MHTSHAKAGKLLLGTWQRVVLVERNGLRSSEIAAIFSSDENLQKC